MAFARHYLLKAAEGEANALAAALTELAAALKGIAGFLSAEILVQADDPYRFVFVEKWVSLEAHTESAPHMPKAVMTAIMEAVTDRPQTINLTTISSL